jgi:hypothetical protein
VRSDLFYAATARQIGREFAGLDPGPGFDVSPESVPMPAVSVDEINWSSTPVETIPFEGGNLRASLIAYRELAQAAIHGLHREHHEHVQLGIRHERLREELRAVRGPSSVKDSDSGNLGNIPAGNIPPARQRRPLSGLSGVPGVSGVRGIR